MDTEWRKLMNTSNTDRQTEESEVLEPGIVKSDNCLQHCATEHGNTKIDKEKALEYLDKGLTKIDIAKILGINRSTLHRFLSKNSYENKVLEQVKEGRADTFTRAGLKCDIVLDKAVSYFADDDSFMELSGNEKMGLIKALVIMRGIYYDKERLERDQSTSNVDFRALVIVGKGLDEERTKLKDELKYL